jgi:nucleoside-diphosphate-sugar epimerase
MLTVLVTGGCGFIGKVRTGEYLKYYERQYGRG